MLRPARFALAVAVALISAATDARADFVNFAFVGSDISGSGVLNLTLNAGSTTTYTAISGTLAVFGDPSVFRAELRPNPNAPGTSVVPGLSATTGRYDNQITPGTAPYLTINGLSFQAGTRAIFIDYFSSSGRYEYYDYDTTSGTQQFYRTGFSFYVGPVQPGTAPIVPNVVPEPASLAMVGLGIAGLGVIARRRRS